MKKRKKKKTKETDENTVVRLHIHNFLIKEAQNSANFMWDFSDLCAFY